MFPLENKEAFQK